jgi:hypothetical protein
MVLALCGIVDEVLADDRPTPIAAAANEPHMREPAPTDVLLVARREYIWLHDRAAAACRR